MESERAAIASASFASRFLVVAPQGLGDSLEATPIVENLRRAYPSAVIDVLVTRPSSRDLFAGLRGFVDEVLYLPYWESGAPAFLRALLRERRRPRYDVAFLAYPAYRPEYQIMMRAFRSRRRFAHRYRSPSFRTMLWLNSDLVPVQSKHNVLRNLDLLQSAGIQVEPPSGYLVPPDWRSDDAPSREHPTVAVHVGTIKHDGLDAKRWPLQNFAAVCRKLRDDGIGVTLIMGPEEREETQWIQSMVPEAAIFEGALAEVARFLGRCNAVLTNDSGIGHLAAGVGARVVSLFGPTPLEYAPFGSNAVALRPSPCPPCFDAATLDMSCKRNIDFACLKRDLRVEDVLRALHDIVDVTRV